MIEQLTEAGRRIVAAEMVKGWAGNLSGRHQGKIIITRSGADLGNLAHSDFVFINPRMPPGTQRLPKPSSELPLHLAAYEADPAIQTVLHTHTKNAISLGLVGHSLPALTPGFYQYLGRSIPLISYYHPGSEELLTAVSDALQSVPAVLLQNHGVVVAGKSVSQALLRLALLEEQAGIYLAALAAGEPRLLADEDIRALDEAMAGKLR